MDTTAKRDEIRRQKNKPWYVKSPWFERELAKALEEIDESHGLEKLFEIQHRRSQEADKRWQEATGKHDTIPDLGDLLRWLMDEIDRLIKDVKTWHDCAEKTTDLWVAAKEKKASIERRTKDAVRDSILENCEPKTEYGPHGQHTEWYTADDIEQAIDSVGGTE